MPSFLGTWQLADSRFFSSFENSIKQLLGQAATEPLAATCNHLQTLATTCRHLHKQPLAATYSHLQLPAATCSHNHHLLPQPPPAPTSSHLQPLTATCSYQQPLAATTTTCSHNHHLHPQAATCSHLQPLAATSSHLQPQPPLAATTTTCTHKQPPAATCRHGQVAASGCFFENQIMQILRPGCKFAKMILRDRSSTSSYDLASLGRESWQAQYFRLMECKNHTTHWHEAISSALTFSLFEGSLTELLRFWSSEHQLFEEVSWNGFALNLSTFPSEGSPT